MERKILATLVSSHWDDTVRLQSRPSGAAMPDGEGAISKAKDPGTEDKLDELWKLCMPSSKEQKCVTELDGIVLQGQR